MSYVKPQVQVFQEYSLASSEVVDPLRAHISGPNAELHRYAEADEKALIDVGAYDRLNDTEYPWPDRTAGSLVDQDSVKLWIENALLMYFEDVIGDTSDGRGVNTPVSGYKNRVTSSTISYQANGTAYPRSSLLNDRDAEIGDVAYIRGVAGVGDDCTEHELWTYIDGFVAEEGTATIFGASNDANNQGSTEAATSISQTGGPTNCIAAVAGGTYDGLADGYVSETYTITVTKSSVSGCNAARLRVVSDSGTDNQDEVTPEDLGSPTDIGTRGLTVTFSDVAGYCSDSASSLGVEDGELTVGQEWTVTVTQAWERTCIEEGATYTGDFDDTYVIEVTKGGLWAALPEVSVTTAKGLDTSGPTVITGANVSFPVGSNGLTAQFKDCGNLSSSSSSGDSVSFSFGMGDDTLAGLRKGDKFHIAVVSGQNGPVRTLILRDDLPTDIQDAADLDVRLFIPKTIEVTENRLSNPPNVNYEIETTQLVAKAGITAYDSTWTKSGVEQAMPVWDGVSGTASSSTEFGVLHIEYREWLTALTGAIGFIDDVADIDEIPGPLDEDNPLKWGVYRALQNSNGTKVGYTAVADPDDLDSWQDVLEKLSGRDDVYNFVPLTYDLEVQNLFHTQVTSESNAEAGNWKAMFVNLQTESTRMVIGKSSADAQALNPTSVDGETVLATLDDNPQATGTQYTRLSVPANNAGFITHGVQAGDVVRYLFSIDAFGDATYTEFVVDSVLSESSLLLLEGHTAPVAVAQMVEIYHTQSKDEMVTDIVDQAQAFADSRVVAVWPDIVGTAGNSQDGYYLGAALAGLVSGVVPHQGLTNVEISGFDDLASRTKEFFTSSQLDQLAEGGVWIATEDRDGTPHTRHALTTSTVDLNSQEEMIRRNVDSISYVFLRRLEPFIGRANATETMLRKLRYEVRQVIKFLANNGYTDELGPQLISGEIAEDEDGQPIVRIHPLSADRVEIVLNLTIPAPLNYLELHLVI